MNETNITSETTKMSVSETMKADLLSSAKWAKFLIILQCIGVVFLAIGGIIMLTTGNNIPTSIFGGAYLVLAAIMIYPTIKGFGFTNNVKSACLTNNEAKLSCAFANMRSCLRFYGILSIIYIIIGIFCLAIAVIIGMALANRYGSFFLQYE